ncbi:MAG: ATP-grasp domain-containing protein [Hyphomicrobiaceae bacterium]
MARLALQNSSLPDVEIIRDFEGCAAAGVEPLTFHMRPFVEEMYGDALEVTGEPIVPLGGTKLVKLWRSAKTPSNWIVHFDERAFDQRTWSAKLGPLAINHDAVFSRLGEQREIRLETAKFVKPCRDLKAFAGLVVPAGQTLGEALAGVQQDGSLTDDEPILLAPLREIEAEFRVWVIGDKIVETSQYKLSGHVSSRRLSWDESRALVHVAEEVHQLAAPVRAYVVDLAYTTEGIRVIEMNCINCAGRYAADRGAIFRALLDLAAASRY